MLALGCGGAGYGGMSEADEVKAIEAVEATATAELQSIVAGDVEANLALMTDDVVIMPPNDRVYTRADAEAFFTGFLEVATVTAAEYVSHEISIHGDVAIDNYVGELTMILTESGETVIEGLKGIHIMKRQADGTWKISQDVWNSNHPVPEM